MLRRIFVKERDQQRVILRLKSRRYTESNEETVNYLKYTSQAASMDIEGALNDGSFDATCDAARQYKTLIISRILHMFECEKIHILVGQKSIKAL